MASTLLCTYPIYLNPRCKYFPFNMEGTLILGLSTNLEQAAAVAPGRARTKSRARARADGCPSPEPWWLMQQGRGPVVGLLA